MSVKQVIEGAAKDGYWAVVGECLCRYHHRCGPAAQAMVAGLRRKVETASSDEAELFYHAEPFDVACDLAGAELDVTAHLDDYVGLRDHHY